MDLTKQEIGFILILWKYNDKLNKIWCLGGYCKNDSEYSP